METQQTKFDWNAWYASIPGIPTGWDQICAGTAEPAVDEMLEAAETPLLEAA